MEQYIVSVETEEQVVSDLAHQFEKLKSDYKGEPYPTLASRLKLLNGLKTELLNHKSELVAALSSDFGNRTEFDSLMADIMPTVSHINYTVSKLKKWMKPSKRHAGLMFTPSSIRVEYQPLGVVGVIAPWNFPIILSIAPAITALAAGNRVMMKLSEFTPDTNKVLRKILEPFSEHVKVVEGEAQVASKFSELAFDHLLFTGSTQVGRYVAQAAAKNLTPCTLELGGKSPAILTNSAQLEKAVDAILFGKCLNAGQICVSPDYLFLPTTLEKEFVERILKRYEETYPKKEGKRNFSHIINQRQHQRLLALLEDAKAKNAQVYGSSTDTYSDTTFLDFQVVTAVTDSMDIMQDEIFGPILPIKTYDSIEDVVKYINDKPSPLALYILGNDKQQNQWIIESTHSGGVAINETVLQVAAEDAPFGGIGESGIGHYHGYEGFQTFSKAKTVFSSPAWLPRNKLLLKYQKLAVKTLGSLFVR